MGRKRGQYDLNPVPSALFPEKGKSACLAEINPALETSIARSSDEMALETAANGWVDLVVRSHERDNGTVPERFGIQVTTLRRAMKRIGK